MSIVHDLLGDEVGCPMLCRRYASVICDGPIGRDCHAIHPCWHIAHVRYLGISRICWQRRRWGAGPQPGVEGITDCFGNFMTDDGRDLVYAVLVASDPRIDERIN